MPGAPCTFKVGYVDATAIVSFSALACTVAAWIALVIATSVISGRQGWMKGAVYYTAYSFSILGLCLLLLYSSLWELYWSESEPDCRLPESLSFMLTLGFPLLLIPPFLLDWRIACIYATTYDWRGRRVSPLVVRDRGTKWLLIRFAILFAPFVALYIGTIWGGEDVVYAVVTLQALLAIGLLGLSVHLIFLRDRIGASSPHLVSHTMCTGVLAIASATLFVTRTTLYFVYPNRQVEGDALDMAIAWLVFLVTLAVLALWLHYLLYIGNVKSTSPSGNKSRLINLGDVQIKSTGGAAVFSNAGTKGNIKSESAGTINLGSASQSGQSHPKEHRSHSPSPPSLYTGDSVIAEEPDGRVPAAEPV